MLDRLEALVLERLTREAAWLRQAARSAEPAGVQFVAVQVLAAIGLEPTSTFETVRDRLGLTKPQLSRALVALRSHGLVDEPAGRYYRAEVPAITLAGETMLKQIAHGLEP